MRQVILLNNNKNKTTKKSSSSSKQKSISLLTKQQTNNTTQNNLNTNKRFYSTESNPFSSGLNNNLFLDEEFVEDHSDKLYFDDDTGGTVNFHHVTYGKTKTWYKNVTVEKEESGLFSVRLDNRKILSRNFLPYEMPTEELAHLVACDWEVQGDIIRRSEMRIAELANEAIDWTEGKRKQKEENLIESLESDALLLFFNNSIPNEEPYRRAQDTLQMPIIKWARRITGLTLNTTDVYNLITEDNTREVFEEIFANMDTFTFAGFKALVDSTKSVILALAVWHRQVSIQDAITISLLDEEYHNYTQKDKSEEVIMARFDDEAEIYAAAMFLLSLQKPAPAIQEFGIDMVALKEEREFIAKQKHKALTKSYLKYLDDLEQWSNDMSQPLPQHEIENILETEDTIVQSIFHFVLLAQFAKGGNDPQTLLSKIEKEKKKIQDGGDRLSAEEVLGNTILQQ